MSFDHIYTRRCLFGCIYTFVMIGELMARNDNIVKAVLSTNCYQYLLSLLI
jgi:hypothetical protein